MTWEEEKQKEAGVADQLFKIAQDLGFEVKPVKNDRWTNVGIVVDPSSGKSVYSFWVWHGNARRKKLYVYSPDHGHETLHDARLSMRQILRTYAEKRLAKIDGLVAELEESFQSRQAVRREFAEMSTRLGFSACSLDLIHPELSISLDGDTVASVIVKDLNGERRKRPIVLKLKKPGTFIDRDHYSIAAAKERLERHLHEWLALKADKLDSLASELGESSARREIDLLVEGRDDIDKLNIPPSGKRYARMKGLKAVTPPRRQDLYVKMVADLVNKGVTRGFKNRDAGEVQHA